MSDDDDTIRPGYYGRTHDGRLVPIGVPHRIDSVVCRRVADFPNGELPALARVQPCQACQAPIAYNPQSSRAYAAGTPRICMQCAGITPDPL
jgi:hypothetical protein